jgi:hypothetical protein
MMLVGAGADTIIQKATTGHLDRGEVAVSGVLGGIGGAGIAARAGFTGLKATIAAGAYTGAISGAGTGAYTYSRAPGPHTVGGFLGATATGAGSGAILGGAGGAAGHGISALLSRGGEAAAGATSHVGSGIADPGVGTAAKTLDDVAPTPATPTPQLTTGNAAPVKEGIYIVNSQDGVYVGQSGDIDTRLSQHVGTGKFTQAEADNAARQEVLGGKTQREIAEQTMVDRLGGKDELLNKVNPVGPNRAHLMPQPYSRPGL